MRKSRSARRTGSHRQTGLVKGSQLNSFPVSVQASGSFADWYEVKAGNGFNTQQYANKYAEDIVKCD